MKRAILFVAFAALCGAQTTVNGGRDYKGTLKASGSVSAVDFSGAGGTAPARAGTSASRPTGCTQGQIYFATDVAAGQNLYFCTATGAPGVWTQMSGNTATAFTAGTGAPVGNCNPPVMYIDTTNQDLWFCGAANSWKRPVADTSGLPTLAGANTWTGYSNLSGGQWRPPESTVANLPSAAGNVGKVFMVTDAVTAGSCSTGGGTFRELCRADGSAYECVGGCGSGGGGGGSGTTAYVSPLISGPDSTRTIAGATHGFATSALLVAVYDSASPRNAISVGWSVNPATYDVGIAFGTPQSNYYVVINGGAGPAGPAGVTGAAGPAGPTVYPGAGVPNSTGSAWGTSYTAGTAANNLVQLNSSGQLPAVSAALLTSFPAFNQNTTGTAAGIAGGSSGQVPFQTGAGATGFSSGFTYNDTTKVVELIGGYTAGQSGTATGTYKLNGATSGTVTITGASSAGTWALTLPTSGGSAGQFLQTNGSGGTTWATVSGSGITAMTAGATDPVATCTAPGASNLVLYTQTTTQELWACVATNTWKKVLSTTSSGTYTATGSVGTAPSNPASGSVACYYSSVSLTQICLDASGNVFSAVKTAESRTANQFVTHIGATGIPVTAALASADIPNNVAYAGVTSDGPNGLHVAGTLSVGTMVLGTDIATPAPDGTKTQLYARGGKWCSQSTAGVETCMGTGSSGAAPVVATFDTTAGTCVSTAGSCVASAGPPITLVLTHNLNTTSPGVWVYDSGGLVGSAISSGVPTSSNVYTFTFSQAEAGTATITTGGVGPTGPAGPTGSPGATGAPGTGTGDASTNTSTSVDSEMTLFGGANGKVLKRATGTGYVKVSSGVMGTPAAIPIGDLPASVQVETKCFDLGADNASADLVDADIGPQGRIFMVPTAATVMEITVAANAGTPSVIVQKNRTGTATDLVSATLVTGAAGIVACAATGSACLDGTAKRGTVTIVTAGSANVLAAGDWIQTKTGSGFASTGAKRLSVCVTYAR